MLYSIKDDPSLKGEDCSVNKIETALVSTGKLIVS